MDSHASIVLTERLSTFLLAAFFLYVYLRKRQSYLLAWSAAWLFVCLFFTARIGVQFLNPGPLQFVYRSLDEYFFALAALAFYCAARLYVNLAIPVRSVIAGAIVGVFWSVAHIHGSIQVTVGLYVGLIFLIVGHTFWAEGRKQESRADVLLGVTFFGWGLLLFLFVIQPRIRGLDRSDLVPMILVPELFTCVLMVMTVYEEERRRVERNMLALSNLNLATSSFAGGEIQKVLSQTLDRVLNVIRLPAGALCMRYDENEGPTSVVVTGLGESFCASFQDANLDGYFVRLVARLGGLVVLRDLSSDGDWQSLEKEEAFRDLRRLLLAQGMRTVIGISLQSKEHVFGVLVLGTHQRRGFTPAELRLLLALGQQIGMAVENSYLIQQSSRRSEELHIMNEVGRALASTLDVDALLERIYSGMRRVLDAASFFIAFYDQTAAEVRYEIEVNDGERRPKRSRPASNQLVEHVVRSAQPLLIRDHFVEEARRLGFEPNKPMASVCAVPLILYDRPVGVMVVHSLKERMFDEGHVELLRVLANEAGIAMENARLFAEEQKKSRQLMLINNVSSHGITTLDPREMLTKIVAEMEKQLPYDHIGIALLNHSAKELVVDAESGLRRDALGRQIQVGEGLIGQVARSGQLSIVREVTHSSPALVLADSVASVAVPVTYGEKFLGVLYVESSEPRDFAEPDVQLLRTLADLFAGALHNALTFQKAQEQAITDGLTGVKTHRFLMETLSSEWKRSMRANRPLSLVLMDLDRFKFVNDFYGHLEGDVVLQRVAQILDQNCRRSDVVARYGGDEFVILMPETSIEQARQLAHKLRMWIAEDALLRDKNITGSFGIAAFPLHGATPQELIQVADSSMYLSKHQGGNAVSVAEQGDPADRKKWKKDVLEAYLGVKLKRLFTTGPDAFEEIYSRLEQFTRSLGELPAETSGNGGNGITGNGGSGSNGLQPAIVETVSSLAFAIDAKDHYTQGHSRKVSAYAGMIAQALGLDQHTVEEIRLGALLHDIGKVGIPEPILNKSGPLDTAEWETMKTHTELGARILEPLKPMARIRLMVRHHHEFYDGSGYPDRLAGERIPFGARVIAIADAYDTITSARSYKKARTPEDAFAELERCAANQFDPEIVRVFIDTMRRAPRPTVEAGVANSAPSHAGSAAL